MFEGKELEAMVYIMNKDRVLGKPDPKYYIIIYTIIFLTN